MDLPDMIQWYLSFWEHRLVQRFKSKCKRIQDGSDDVTLCGFQRHSEEYRSRRLVINRRLKSAEGRYETYAVWI